MTVLGDVITSKLICRILAKILPAYLNGSYDYTTSRLSNNANMAAASEFPPELATRPLGLIALIGLEITHKVLHKAIWESFSVNKHPDRVPLSFKLLPVDHEYPRAKQKVSFFWFIFKHSNLNRFAFHYKSMHNLWIYSVLHSSKLYLITINFI